VCPEKNVESAKESLLALCRKIEEKDPEFKWQVREISATVVITLCEQESVCFKSPD
jgi:hypothetical protein